MNEMFLVFCDPPRTMDFPQESYYKLNRTLLSLVGQWPYGDRRNNIIRRCFVYLAFLSWLICQITKIIELHFHWNKILETYTHLVIFLTMFSLFTLNIRGIDQFQELWEEMKRDWCSDRMEEETRIKERYAEESKLITKAITIVVFVELISLAIFATFFTTILDVIIPLNQSRKKVTGLRYEFFLDEEKYFYWIIIYMSLSAFVVATSGVANLTAFCMHLQHACGMLEALGYRLQNAIPNDGNHLGGSVDPANDVCYRSLSICINRHREATQFAATLESYYSNTLCIVMLMEVLIISPALVQLSEKVEVLAIGQMCYSIVLLYVVSYFGQRMIDMSSSLKDKIYCSKWYECSLRSQKLLPLIILRCERPSSLTAYNFCTISLDCFRIANWAILLHGPQANSIITNIIFLSSKFMPPVWAHMLHLRDNTRIKWMVIVKQQDDEDYYLRNDKQHISIGRSVV
ncbi:putative odorant receptor 92a [Prorops nasuta]|uniref:putative odorant receptor 92a n=1 Tax=Prorops nasuta TaxID=863751 RepID=UPI0034CF6979